MIYGLFTEILRLRCCKLSHCVFQNLLNVLESILIDLKLLLLSTLKFLDLVFTIFDLSIIINFFNVQLHLQPSESKFACLLERTVLLLVNLLFHLGGNCLDLCADLLLQLSIQRTVFGNQHVELLDTWVIYFTLH